jgi:hypothetical protein
MRAHGIDVISLRAVDGRQAVHRFRRLRTGGKGKILLDSVTRIS